MSPTKKRGKGRGLLYLLIMLLLMVGIPLLLGEVIARIILTDQYSLPQKEINPPYDCTVPDAKWGWKVKANYHFDGPFRDKQKNPYHLIVHTNANGFRAFGDTSSEQQKVLFIGDSFTLAIEASDDKTFHALLADSLGVEVFAYGAFGFGNYQEYLVLNEWLDKIKPDVVVWQFCANDFIDNYHELERFSRYKVGKRRPYLDLAGKEHYEHPRNEDTIGIEKPAFYLIAAISQFFSPEKHNPLQAAEDLIFQQQRDYGLFDESVLRTEKIVALFRARVPDSIPIIAFTSTHRNPYYAEQKRICETNGFHWVDGIPQKIRETEQQGTSLRSLDGYHWNEQGHVMVAGMLLGELAKSIGSRQVGGRQVGSGQ